MSNDASIATTFPGFEELCRTELEELGLPIHSVSRGAVAFGGGTAGLYTATLWSRTALRVLRPVASFHARDAGELYTKGHRVPWERWFRPDTTFAVDATTSSSIFTHSHYAALKVKDALVDRLREHLGARPNVDVERPAMRVRVHVRETLVNLSLDAAGDSLHRRGYRLEHGEAPLNETVAAALLRIAGYGGQLPLVDPFCGAGTIPIEAALAATNVAPGLLREHHALECWSDHEPALWESLRKSAQSQQRPASHLIVGADTDPALIESAQRNAERAGVANALRLVVSDFRELEPPQGPGLVVTNPPYGVRLAATDLAALYTGFGDRLKCAYDRYDAWLLSGAPALLKRVGLRAGKRIPVLNGNLDCRFVRFTIRGKGARPPSAGIPSN